MPQTKTPEPLKGSVDPSTNRERARLLDDGEVDALVAMAEAEADDDEDTEDDQ